MAIHVLQAIMECVSLTQSSKMKIQKNLNVAECVMHVMDLKFGVRWAIPVRLETEMAAANKYKVLLLHRKDHLYCIYLVKKLDFPFLKKS